MHCKHVNNMDMHNLTPSVRIVVYHDIPEFQILSPFPTLLSTLLDPKAVSIAMDEMDTTNGHIKVDQALHAHSARSYKL